MCVEPGLRPFASPMSTVATVLLLLDQAKDTPVIGFPFWSYPRAVNCCTPPTKIEGVAGVTAMLVSTGGGGSTISDAGALLTPEADAVICAVPDESPVARPALIVAIEPSSFEPQVNVIPVITLLNWSYPVAVNVVRSPT